MNFSWTDEERLWRKTVRDFAQTAIRPLVRDIDRNERIPSDIIKGMAQIGLLAPVVSEDYGGAGANWTMAAIAAEELGRADISLAIPVLYLVEAAWGFILDQYGSPELKSQYLPRVTRGEAFLGIATTEPGGGTDILRACQTRAREENVWRTKSDGMCVIPRGPHPNSQPFRRGQRRKGSASGTPEARRATGSHSSFFPTR